MQSCRARRAEVACISMRSMAENSSNFFQGRISALCISSTTIPRNCSIGTRTFRGEDKRRYAHIQIKACQRFKQD